MAKKRNVYLNMQHLAEARRILFERFSSGGRWDAEAIAVLDSVGRITAAPVYARFSSPHFHAAAMDGIAVKAELTFGATPRTPKTLRTDRDTFYVNTGHVLPPGTDAVIKIEQVTDIGNHQLQIEAPAFPWQYVRRMGEDIVATELLFPSNHCITPYCLGALISGGVFQLAVRPKPRVLIIPTGSELVDWRTQSPTALAPGQVLESNAYVLGKLAEAIGCEYVHHATITDDATQIEAAVARGIRDDFDTVLICGGSSAGSHDYARQVIESLGDVLVHGVTMMPGKPVIIGAVKDRPVFGIPGYPVSAIMAYEQFVQPYLTALLGRPEPRRTRIDVRPTRKIASKLGLEEFIRVKLGRVGDQVVATSLPRGAGSITSLTQAHGIIRVPPNVDGLSGETPVPAELLGPLDAVDNTIVAVGSHDNTLDVLADLVKLRAGHVTLSSSHVGSMGGLMAVKKGGCHLAGTHLLDTTDGTYNKSYVQRLLPDLDVKLIHLVQREQGLIVPPGNPKNITGIEDLKRDDVRFINRQTGSGTRILLDYRLTQAGITADVVNGYSTEEFTHMAVAVAVLSGTVDVGLGIYAAAKALGLDFVPVVTEQYDLVIPSQYLDLKIIQILLTTIGSETFKQRVADLGGYSTAMTGQAV